MRILLENFVNLTYLFKKRWRGIVVQYRSCDLVCEGASTILLINTFQWFPLKIIYVTKCHCASNVTCLWKEVTIWSSQEASHIRTQKKKGKQVLLLLVNGKWFLVFFFESNAKANEYQNNSRKPAKNKHVFREWDLNNISTS